MERFSSLTKWYNSKYANDEQPLVVAGDASSRKFYRVKRGILMDSLPAIEKNDSFVKFSEIFNQGHVHVPKIKDYDAENGFFLVEDLGDTTLEKAIENCTIDTVVQRFEFEEALFKKALNAIKKIQSLPQESFPIYDEKFIRNELDIFYEWGLTKGLKVKLTNEEDSLVKEQLDLLAKMVDAVPKAVMHRDFHTRNIMVKNERLSFVDFQDAMVGSVVYDLASLLGDVYLPEVNDEFCSHFAQIYRDEYMRKLTVSFYKYLEKSDIYKGDEFVKYINDLNLTSLQRHLKCIGIFYRLSLRDHKDLYLQYIPKLFEKIMYELKEVPQLHDLAKLLIKVFLKFESKH